MEATDTKTTQRRWQPALRGHALRCMVLLLWIAWASARPERLVTKKQELSHLSFHKKQNTAAVAAKPRSLSVPPFMELHFKNSFRPGHKAQLHHAKEEHDGERRVQDACDTERTAFYSCLPDDSCVECFEGEAQKAITEPFFCRTMEISLCAIPTSCSCSSGCESEAESLIQCVYEERGCTTTVDCSEAAACDAELITMENCDSMLNVSCLSCVDDAHDTLFPTQSSTAWCLEIKDTLCPAVDSCGCGDCSDEVLVWYSCLFSENCNEFDCDTPSCDVEQEAFYGCLPDDICKGCYQGAIQVATQESTLCLEYESRLCAISSTCPCGSGCEEEAEILFQCINEGCPNTISCSDTACEEESIAVADCVAGLDDDPCVICLNDSTDVPESAASCNEFEEAFCPALKTCGCDYCSDKVRDWYSCLLSEVCPAIDCRTPSPTMAPTMSPTDVGPCLVCGKPTLTVDSSKTAIMDGNSRPCGEVQEEYTSKQVTEFECNVLVDLVEKSCGCQDIPPPTIPPTSPPDQNEPPSNLAALSALVAIPFVAIIVYLVMNRKKEQNSGDNRKASRNPDAPEYEFDETPPVTPSRTTPSRRYNGDHSITESSEEDHYMYGRNHGGEVASQNSGGVPPSGNSIQSGGDQSGGTRRSRDPSGVTDYTAPHASLPAPRPTAGGEQLFQPKDQCRSVPPVEHVPVAYVVETGEFLAQNQDQ